MQGKVFRSFTGSGGCNGIEEEKMVKRTPIKAIRAKCIECSAGQIAEVRLCVVKKCPLYPYRMGHRPKDGETINEND